MPSSGTISTCRCGLKVGRVSMAVPRPCDERSVHPRGGALVRGYPIFSSATPLGACRSLRSCHRTPSPAAAGVATEVTTGSKSEATPTSPILAMNWRLDARISSLERADSPSTRCTACKWSRVCHTRFSSAAGSSSVRRIAAMSAIECSPSESRHTSAAVRFKQWPRSRF